MNNSTGLRQEYDRSFLQFSEVMRNCGSTLERWNELTKFTADLGYEKGAYIIVPKYEGRVENRQPVYFSNHDSKWVEHYQNNRYYFKDPGMAHILNGSRADQLWTDYTSIAANGVSTDFIDDVQSAGLRFGMNLSLECANKQLVSGASFASCEQTQAAFDTQMASKYTTLKNAVQLFHSYAQPPGQLQEFFGFSPRELECLLWLTAGRANKEIAHILHISEKTVEHHIKRACQKLHVTNRTHAVARAMSFQLLSL
ncbi:LuxR family transcriptional regulator [Pseudovibrio sp. Tun.PSC04-5.I4]|uniref:helix-turn-helix transcriptional regulator n=1 Tax=Pseudovibrio sp. Tun.PSC04-5.I4 TaxID=1798213 RepID=UPI000887721F|nr:LuxR family transcriptional regulator [Pseudovibrio sp. Tun.PSC04-5.I4]SDQ79219.1 LuxR family transcriptional regulator [Pseudovibrio sp. Tun.PSC04-5.I4]